MAAQVYAEALPLVGDELRAAFDQGNQALATVTAMKSAIVGALASLNSAADYTEAVVQQAINAALNAAGFVGNLVNVVISGSDVTLTFAETRSQTYSQALDADLGLPGLGIETAGSAQAQLDFALNLTMGVDATGFFVGTGGSNEITLGLDITAPSLTVDATLGSLNFNATDTGSSLIGDFAIDLRDANNDGKLRIDELGGHLLDATLTANANIDVALLADMGTAALPQIGADLSVDWTFVASTVNPDDDNSGFGALPTVSFNNVTMNLGSFIEGFVQPVLAQLEPILQPINTVLAVINSDIAVLKSIPNWQTLFERTGDDKITLLDLLKLAQPSLDLAPIQSFIDMVGDVLDWAEFLNSTSFGPDEYVIGDFQLSGGQDIRNLGFVLENAPTTFGGFVDTLDTVIAGLSGSGWDAVDTGSGKTGGEIMEALVTGGNFAFPILNDPSQIIRLLLGGTADLALIDLPDVLLSASKPDLAQFSFFPGINAVVGGGVSLAFDLAFGFDTRGLTDFNGEPGSVINGLYILDGANPEVEVSASINIGVALDFLIASLYGGGDITGTVEFDLSDTLGEVAGRIYLDEMLAALQDNPFSIFDTSGSITGGIHRLRNGSLWRDLAIHFAARHVGIVLVRRHLPAGRGFRTPEPGAEVRRNADAEHRGPGGAARHSEHGRRVGDSGHRRRYRRHGGRRLRPPAGVFRDFADRRQRRPVRGPDRDLGLSCDCHPAFRRGRG